MRMKVGLLAWSPTAGKRRRMGWVGGALWIACFCLAGAARAGWVIEQVEYANPGAEGTKTTQYIAKNRLKTVGESNLFIMDFQTNTFTAVDPEKKIFWAGAVQEYVQEVQKFQRAASDLARQQMQEALKDLPAEQRKPMEEMLKQLEGAGTLTSPQVRAKRPQVRVEHTQDTATIAGYKARRAIVIADGKPYQEVWLAKGLELKGDLDPKRMRGLQAMLAQAILFHLGDSHAIEADPAYEKMLEEGYPVKFVGLGEEGEPESVIEVVRVEKRDLPEKEFQPPDGYRRIDLGQFFREELERIRRGE